MDAPVMGTPVYSPPTPPANETREVRASNVVHTIYPPCIGSEPANESREVHSGNVLPWHAEPSPSIKP